ncbi:helix-turn-helix transcriptional regulator [Romboutsia sp. CE17]|uniref:winged helix-turn-helix transcriptional regulator n=1 Tax=Romboutsia sp. CE17 TaxID=2724150 RepID=UPI001442B2BD|nr:helix-turn-helix domain-containing protein [Romboutsia sp. CE17]QJA09304.1 helix-turn-helix transcriptional regulator [Romboutsia sp. CE17]
MSLEFSFHSKCHKSRSCAKYDTCPMFLFHKLVSGKWKLLILWYLSDGCLRFSELKKKLPDVTQKMLTNQLRSLEEDNLIIRKVYPVIPPHVEYSLSEMGEKMLPLLEDMYAYGIDYLSSENQRKSNTNNE